MLCYLVLTLPAFMYVFLCSASADTTNAQCKELTVATKYGKVRGTMLKTERQKPYYAFRGIPYAQPPVGQLRFSAPIPPKHWTGVLNAKEDKNICMQFLKDGSEDCLNLNVYSPKLRNSSFPVMVWIYGGFFLQGQASTVKFGPDYLIEEDVIVVTLNYRVGIFGFLSTEDEVAPGNYALKDQILALKWVKENIANFGGDVNRITVFGESAGSVATSYLVQSPAAKGLFHRAIMQSGVSLSLFALSREPKSIAVALGKDLGIESNDTRTLVDELRKVDANRLQTASTTKDLIKTVFSNARNGLYYAPVIEPVHKGAVVTNKSHEDLKNGHFNQVPIIVGYNSAEANPFADALEHIKLYLAQYDLDPKKLIPVDMNVEEDSELQERIASEIRHKFFGLTPVILSSEKLSDFISSDQFFRPTNEYVKLFSQRSPTYFYVLSYEGKLGQPVRTKPGVGHGEDLSYIWRQNDDAAIIPENDDILTRRRIVKLWANFAKFSDPTPQKDTMLDNVLWPASDPDNLTYLNIGPSLTVDSRPNDDTFQFWQDLYGKYGHPPYDTY